LPIHTLQLGASGAAVANLQLGLDAVMVDKSLTSSKARPPLLVVDGKFGTSTDAGLRGFQASARLRVDGVFGQNTQIALLKALVKRGLGHLTGTPADLVYVPSNKARAEWSQLPPPATTPFHHLIQTSPAPSPAPGIDILGMTIPWVAVGVAGAVAGLAVIRLLGADTVHVRGSKRPPG